MLARFIRIQMAAFVVIVFPLLKSNFVSFMYTRYSIDIGMKDYEVVKFWMTVSKEHF